jgi:hypothetical protein
MPMVEEAMQKYETAFEVMKTNLIHSGLDEQHAGKKKLTPKSCLRSKMSWKVSTGCIKKKFTDEKHSLN